MTQNPKHWSNEATVLQYIDNILVPNVTRLRSEEGLAADQEALLIFDTFSGHLTVGVKQKLASNHINYVMVPPNLTNRFQPLDVSVNKAAKNVVRKCYSEYYSGEVQRQLTTGVAAHYVAVDLRLSVLKVKHASWIVEIFNKVISFSLRKVFL